MSTGTATWRWHNSLVGAVVILVALGGCSLRTGASGATATPTVPASPSPADPQTEQLRKQAREALERWADAVAAAGGQPAFVLVGEMTGVAGTSEDDYDVASNNKMALMAGMVEAGISLPTETPQDGEVRFRDGTSLVVAAISADEALRELRAAGSQACAECVPLRVTAARLTTAQIQTSRGLATAPAWEFTLEGTGMRLTRPAISVPHSVTVTPPARDPMNPRAGPSIESATGTVGGRELTVVFSGSPLPGDKPCGADYTAEAVESALAVVVIVISHPHPSEAICAMPGAERSAIAQLAAPLGERTLLEVQEGLPVPVVLAP